MIPFHKQTNASKLAGQIVYPLPETPNKQAGQIVNPIPEQFLHQYIERKTDEPKRITFDEWYKQRYTEVDDPSFIYDARDVWNAALTKGKL